MESEYYLELHFIPKQRYDNATKKYKYKLTDYCHMRGKVENEQRRGKSFENPEYFRQFDTRGLTSPTVLSAATR